MAMFFIHKPDDNQIWQVDCIKSARNARLNQCEPP